MIKRFNLSNCSDMIDYVCKICSFSVFPTGKCRLNVCLDVQDVFRSMENLHMWCVV